MRRKLEQGPKLQALLRTPRTRSGEVMENIYLTLLSRFPTRSELALITTQAQAPGADPRTLVQDVVWALVNSAEFLHRH